MQHLLPPLRKKKTAAANHWGRDDGPRERLKINGPQALSDRELLCLILGRNTPRKPVADLARAILFENGDDLHRLAGKSVGELEQLKLEGFGNAKASAVVAAFELGRRHQAHLSSLERPVFKNPAAAAPYLIPLFCNLKREVFTVLCLDQGNALIHHEKISEGGITATYVDPRVIFKIALREEAVSIILAHNHPSGSLRPSRADQILTDRIKEGANYLDIKLLDHIIVGAQGFFSFANEGLL
jgi:DNA repair protein RadC